MPLAEDLTHKWQSRLQKDYPNQTPAVHAAVTQWLIGSNPQRFEQYSDVELAVVRQAIEYRYRILQQRYWDVTPERAYQQLIKRLGSLFLIRSKIRTWIALSRDRRRTVTDVLQEVIQEMLQSDNHLRRQIDWISECTSSRRLRNTLMLASIEEYCLRPIRNQPLLVYRFVNYLRRSQKGGMTQVPTNDLVRLISDEIATNDDESSLSLLDLQTLAAYQEQQDWVEQQAARTQVKERFLRYLSEHLDSQATQWLELHLQGYSQEMIAQQLAMPIQQVYRLREKISYHAIRVFTLKEQPQLVHSWLKTSLKEHNLGLTPIQWQEFFATCDPQQQHLLSAFKDGKSVDLVAKELNLRPKQVLSEWAKLYLTAQDLRNAAV
ncbi:MAG: HetZ-related protein 2 [Leptolyngbya sp. SIO4C5]|uniref:HetZ-related protein 2 n=1 Tax=Sphaerothrix gracilis TaxID=3151835 RepID=UPI0013C1F702|nr:HetZ-related protein 2 [Leptolyngbya sp. SIO4C5]